MKIIVALGNPGEKYKKTRHNAAWLFVDRFLGNINWQNNKTFTALTYNDNKGNLFIKPLSFMNNSGFSVQKVLSYYNLISRPLVALFKKKDQDLSQVLLVIQDELDLNFGETRLSINSQSAGHKGIESIINILKTKNFSRLRLGIKNENLKTKIPADRFVLQNFSQMELQHFDQLVAENEHYLK